MDIDGGELLQELFQIRRKIMQTDAVNGRDTDGAGYDILNLLDTILQGIVSLDNLFAVFVKDLPFTGEPEFLFAALDEDGFEVTFERANLLADSGLSHVIDLGRLRETLCFGKISKNFQALNLHEGAF